jgi:predicted enzyme related to lactoylglutathione lyase
MPQTRWSGVTIDCADPSRLAEFWSALLKRDLSETLPGWARLGTHDDALPVICFQPVPEPKGGKVRVHLDITVDEIERGVARAVELGGRPTGERHDYDEGVVVVMVDPEDNEFCLVQYFRSGSDGGDPCGS